MKSENVLCISETLAGYRSISGLRGAEIKTVTGILEISGSHFSFKTK